MPRFQPGQSGNPGGRPRDQGEARRVARRNTVDAVFALTRVCLDTSASPDQLLRAASILLAYGYGPVAKQGCSPAGARGRWPGLRTRCLALLDTLAWQDPDHPMRAQMLAMVDELEREEGLTETRPDDSA